MRGERQDKKKKDVGRKEGKDSKEREEIEERVKRRETERKRQGKGWELTLPSF